MLTTARGDVLTVGVVLAIYFASSGIESLRIGLNRAYGVAEQRRWWLLRLESIAYVLVAAIALLVLAFLVVLAPLIFAAAARYVPWLNPLLPLLNFLRIAVASVVLIVGAADRAQMAAGRPAPHARDRAGHRCDAGAVARGGRSVRPLSRRLRLYLCHLLRRPCLGDDRAGVPLS